MSIPFSWFWTMASEVAVIVVLIGWVSRGLGFAFSPALATGWKRVALMVVGILSAAFLRVVGRRMDFRPVSTAPRHNRLVCGIHGGLGYRFLDRKMHR